MRSPGRFERFDSEWNTTTFWKSGPAASSMPGGASLAVDLAIAFVGENEEAEAARQRGELFEISAIGDRALRIGRRGEIDRDRARQEFVVERIEIGQKAGRRRRRQIDRLAIGRDRACRISRIERIGDQHRGLAGTLRHVIFGGKRGEEKSLARAVEHQHFGARIDRRARAQSGWSSHWPPLRAKASRPLFIG